MSIETDLRSLRCILWKENQVRRGQGISAEAGTSPAGLTGRRGLWKIKTNPLMADLEEDVDRLRMGRVGLEGLA